MYVSQSKNLPSISFIELNCWKIDLLSDGEFLLVHKHICYSSCNVEEIEPVNYEFRFVHFCGFENVNTNNIVLLRASMVRSACLSIHVTKEKFIF